MPKTLKEVETLLKDGGELVFDNEDEQSAVFMELQDMEPTEDHLDLIQKIRGAKVSESPETDEELEEPGGETPPDDQKPEVKVSVDSSFAGLTLPSETYTDDDGQEKPFFTFKTVQSAIDSIVPAQRHIKYLEKKRLPQVYNEGYNKAKTEYEKTVSELKAQIEEARKGQKPPEKPAETPAPISGVDFSGAVAELQKINPDSDDYDFSDHLKAQHNVILAYADQNAKLMQELKGIKETSSKFSEFETNFKKRQEEETRITEEQKAQEQKKRAWLEDCKSIDSYAESNGIKSSGFDAMTKSALTFHQRLATAVLGHTASANEAEEIGAMFVSGDPRVIQAANENGLKAPENYQQWVYLDNIDAVRGGLIRGTDGKWTELKDSNGNRIRFPDHATAAEYFHRVTGKKQEDIAKLKKDASANIVDKISRRDQGVITMDTSKTLDDGEGGEITKEEAVKVLEEYAPEIEDILREARFGSKVRFDNLNAARAILGLPAIKID